MKTLLKTSKLAVSYGQIKALKGVDIEVEEGSIVAILGSNGGGKTTLLKKISGLIDAEEGSVEYDGEDITKLPAEKIAQLGIIQSPEGRQIFPDLTVEENLRIGAFTLQSGFVKVSRISETIMTPKLKQRIELAKEAALDGKEAEVLLTRKERIENNKARVYRYFPVLQERNTQVANTLSGGEQQMLAISRALMASPRLLILDEPSLGLAPLIVRDIFNIIKEFKNEGVTILIVEQNALQTLKIADYAYVIQVGEMIMDGTAKSLMNNPALIDAYMGH
jgi:branched-chain amino acid transport system ATP-binding protein